MKRRRGQKSRLIIQKAKVYYPMAFCLHENKPIAVSQLRCKKKVKVHWVHWTPENAKFLPGYEFSLKDMRKGDKCFCPKCGHAIDFRFWMSDTKPDIK